MAKTSSSISAIPIEGSASSATWQSHSALVLQGLSLPYIFIDDNFRLIDQNQAARAWLANWEISNINAASINTLPISLISVLKSKCSSVFEGRSSTQVVEQAMRAPSGTLWWLRLQLSRLSSQDQVPRLYGLLITDITAQKSLEHRLSIQQIRLQRLLDAQTHYVVCSDLEGTHTYWNKVFEEDYGWLYAVGGIAGSSVLRSICEHDHAKVLEVVNKCIAKPGESFRVELDKPGKLGSIRSTLWEFMCILDEMGAPFEIQCTGIEITQLRQLRESEKLLNESQRLAKLGSWNFDFRNDSLTWSDALYDVFGVDRLTFKETHGSFLDLLDPADRRIATAVSKRTQETGEPFHIQYKITTPNGERRVIEEFGHAEMDEQGKVIRLFGTAQNVTDRVQQEEKILNSDRIFEHATDMLSISGYDGHFITINPAWTWVLGWSKEELLSKPFTEFVHPDDWAKTFQEYELVGTGAGSKAFENRYLCKDGSYRWLSWNSISYPEEQKIYASARDITTVKTIEASLNASEERFRKIIQYGSDITVLLDAAGTQTLVSAVAEKITGYSPAQLTGKGLVELIHPDDQPQLMAVYQDVLQHPEKAFQAHYRHIHKSQGWVWLEATVQNFLNNPEFNAVLLKVRDIGETRAKTLLLQKMQVAFEQSPSTIVITDVAGNIELANPKFEEITGYTIEEVLGKNPRILQSGLQSPQFYQQMWATLTEGKVWKGELCNKKKNGDLYWESATITPLFDGQGKICNYLAVKEDITEQRAAREVIAQSKERYKSIIEVSNTGAWEFNVPQKQLWVSDGYLQMLGYSSKDFDQLRAKGYALWTDLLHPEDKSKAIRTFEHYWNNGEVNGYDNHFRLVGKNKKTVWIWSRGKRLSKADGSLSEVILGTHIDISSIKLAEQKIKENELYYRTLLKAQPDMMFVMDKSFVFLDYKAKEGDLYTKPEAFLGKPIDAVMPAENAQFTKNLILQAFKSRKLVESEYELTIQGKVRHFNARVVALDNEKAMITIRDNTESTEYLNRIKKLLSQEEEQKKRLLNFTHIVSHNLRSHTANMQGILLLMDLEAPELLEIEYVKLIRNSANNLNQTLLHLNEVLDISRNLESKFEPTSIHKSIALSLESVQSLAAEKGIKIAVHGLNEDLQLRAIPAYLDSILLNILTNAIKFSDPQKQQRLIKVSLLKMPSCLLISIADNGLGLDMKRHGGQIFGMYKTFHNHSDSKGLGLFITKNQVEAMGGQIKVKSRVGKGSIFKVYLPR